MLHAWKTLNPRNHEKTASDEKRLRLSHREMEPKAGSAHSLDEGEGLPDALKLASRIAAQRIESEDAV